MSVEETIAAAREDNVKPPMVAPESALADQAWAFLRQVLPPIVAFLVGRHLLSDDTGTLILSMGTIVVPIVIGQLKTRLRAIQLIKVEKVVDDAVLTTKAKLGA